MDRRSFLKYVGLTALGATGIAAMMPEVGKSIDPMMEFIMERMRDQSIHDRKDTPEFNVADAWYKISNRDVGEKPEGLLLQYGRPVINNDEFGYLAIIRHPKDSISYLVRNDSTIVPFRNMADLTYSRPDEIAEEMFRSIKGKPSTKVNVAKIDSTDFKKTVSYIYQMLGG